MLASNAQGPPDFHEFLSQLRAELETHGQDNAVVGFKSVICYRTGLEVLPVTISTWEDKGNEQLQQIFDEHQRSPETKVRIVHLALNESILLTTLDIAGRCGKPGEPMFHFADDVAPPEL